jgi:CRISPR-associated protein Cas2
MFFVIAYDMPDNKRRTKLLKAMKGFGVHTQFSLFECELDEHELEHMLAVIRKIIKPSEDAVKVYRLCSDCVHAVRVIGLGRVAVEPECVII